MAVALLKDPPLAPSEGLGPYREEDYAALPDEPRCELLFGRFYLSPSPTVLHQIVVSLLWLELHRCAVEAGGLALFAPLDLGLADHTVVQPDDLYYSAERRKLIGEQLEIAPDLVAEVLSPGTARRDRGEKLSLYAQTEIREYWIVDPAEKQIEFLILRDGRYTVALPCGEIYRSEALPEVRLDLNAFWHDVGMRLA
jgi:Uma2 family endonuclease